VSDCPERFKQRDHLKRRRLADLREIRSADLVFKFGEQFLHRIGRICQGMSVDPFGRYCRTCCPIRSR